MCLLGRLEMFQRSQDLLDYFFTVAKYEFSNTKFQGFSRLMTRPTGRVKWCSKCHGSGQVGSGRVKRFSNLVGRVRAHLNGDFYVFKFDCVVFF